MPSLLNEQQVIEILHNTTDSNAVIAKKYGVSHETIGKIFRNVNWKHIPRPNLKRDIQLNSRKLTEDIVRAVRNFERTDYEEIAKEYGCLVKTVKQLLCPNNMDWKYIPVKGYENYNGARIGSIPLRKSAVKEIFLDRHISEKTLAEKYNVGIECIKSIRSGKRHGKYTATLIAAGHKIRKPLKTVRRDRTPQLGEFTKHTHPFVKFMWEDIIRRDIMPNSVAQASGVDSSTLYKWRNNSPKGPYLCQMEYVLQALGYKLEIARIND